MSVISCLSLQLPSMPLISVSHFTPGPSSFLEPKESSLLESPWLLSLPFHLRESPHLLVPTFFLFQVQDPTSGIQPQNRKPRANALCWAASLDRQWAWGKGFLRAPTPCHPRALPRTDGLH